jgi:hypothetical protein
MDKYAKYREKALTKNVEKPKYADVAKKYAEQEPASIGGVLSSIKK